MIYFRPKKYGNKTCFVDGIRFDSRREADYYGQLKIEKRAKLILDFDRQVAFNLYGWRDDLRGGTFARVRVCSHIVDFLVEMPDGKKVVREVKSYGTMTDVWKIKHKLFEVNYPEIPYEVII